MDRLIAQHRGRIANTAGDSVLAEFPRAVDAVECAIEVQSSLAEANRGASPGQQLRFRIGVHVGEVIVRAGDLFGEGDNLAARLQAAATGGLCISEAAHAYASKSRRASSSGGRHDLSRACLDFCAECPVRFHDHGVPSLKNVESPGREPRRAADSSYPASQGWTSDWSQCAEHKSRRSRFTWPMTVR